MESLHHLCLFFSLAMLVGGGQASGHKKVSLILTWKKKNELQVRHELHLSHLFSLFCCVVWCFQSRM